MAERVAVRENVLKENDRIAGGLRDGFGRHGIYCVNLISSPGAGKTSILEGTLETLRGTSLRAAVLTGDIQTERDADRLRRYGFPALQITTGGTCHLDASMVARALPGLPLDALDVLFIENVGNLVCPASYDLGEDAKVVVLSVAEGDDKPLKYPGIFRRARLMLLHKMDLLPHTRFDPAAAVADARRVQPDLEVIETSCYGPPGLDGWVGWLGRRQEEKRAARAV
ncbi:MAG: hydrogenase accessory protein HypB [Acidobacteria bacterium]|nr:hydrogenase accessory protein HypB [Acidobacteriota bacterium]